MVKGWILHVYYLLSIMLMHNGLLHAYLDSYMEKENKSQNTIYMYLIIPFNFFLDHGNYWFAKIKLKNNINSVYCFYRFLSYEVGLKLKKKCFYLQNNEIDQC